MALDTIMTSKGQILGGPMTYNQRKKWFKDNLNKIMYLDFVFIERANAKGVIIRHKLSLIPFKMKQQAMIDDTPDLYRTTVTSF